MLIYGHCFSQKTIQNQRDWFSYTGQYKLSDKWGFHIEAQFRLDNQLQQNLQNAFKIGGIYYISQNQNLIGGYALVNAFNTSFKRFYIENRFWEQYQITKKWNSNKNTMTHRFRLEQRFIENVATDLQQSNSSNYQNRFRYLNRNLFHLANLTSTNNEIYAIAQEELFLILGENKINSKLVDQSRFMVGLGLNCNNDTRLELGYVNQFVTSVYGEDTMNHVISVSLFHNLDLQKH